MPCQFPFGEYVRPLVQQDRTPRKVFVLGVYASAVHARWTWEGQIICQALAVASEPRIFWEGDPDEAREIIAGIRIPGELGKLEPAGGQFNGPSGRALDEHVLAPLGCDRSDAWLCDCLPESRLNPRQQKVIRERYNPLIERYGLNEATIPTSPSVYCDAQRAEAITDELMRSGAELLVLLGDIPLAQYLARVADIPCKSIQKYAERFGYGQPTQAQIRDRVFEVLPLVHPRQSAGLGRYSPRWQEAHLEWERKKRV